MVNQLELSKINIAFVLGSCLGKVGEVEGQNVYLIKPALTGRIGEPVKIITTLSLSDGVTYLVKGNPNTFVVNNVTSLYIEATNVVKAWDNCPLIYDIESDIAKACGSNFVYIEDMSISSIKKADSGLIIGLEKVIGGPRLTSYTTTKGIVTHKYLNGETLVEGQLVSVFGSIQKDKSKSRETNNKEVNLKIFKINPSSSEINSWLSVHSKLLNMTEGKVTLSALTEFDFDAYERNAQ